MGIFVMLSFSCYLRPSECIRLRGNSLVPPQPSAGPMLATWGLILHDGDLGIAGKTGITDELVLVDLDAWLWPCLQILREQRLADQPILDFSLVKRRDAYSVVMSRLRVTNVLMTHLYGLRHGGASHEMLTGVRSLSELMKRGRWRSEASVKRYEKGGRVNQVLNALPPPLLEKAVQAADTVGDLLWKTS